MLNQPTAGPNGPASHNLTGRVPRTSDDLTSGTDPSLQLIEPCDLLSAAELKSLGLPTFAPTGDVLDRMLSLITAANGYRPPNDWVGDHHHRARAAWLLISPSGAIVSMGLSQHEAMKAAGLGLELPAGFRVARLTVDGDLAALDAVIDTIHQAWTNADDLSPELREQWTRVNSVLRAQQAQAELRAAERERLSRALAATPVADPAAEPYDLEPDGDTEELPFDAGVRP